MKHCQSLYLHDDLLFLAQLLTGFFALLRLGELTFPDDARLCNPSKVAKRSSVTVDENSFSFFLPSHKGDKFFEGNTIVLMKSLYPDIPTFHHFSAYLISRDHLFPFSSPLWLTSDGSVPTRSFFLQRLHYFFGDDVGGQSMRAGGATDLALRGTPPSLIQPVGRWTSESMSANTQFLFKLSITRLPLLYNLQNKPKNIHDCCTCICFLFFPSLSLYLYPIFLFFVSSVYSHRFPFPLFPCSPPLIFSSFPFSPPPHIVPHLLSLFSPHQ